MLVTSICNSAWAAIFFDQHTSIIWNKKTSDLQDMRSCVGIMFITIKQIMKAILLTTALAAFGLAVLPLHADEASPKPAVEKAAVQPTPVYLVQVSGAG